MAVTIGSNAFFSNSTLYMLFVFAPPSSSGKSGQPQFLAPLPPAVQSHYGVRPNSGIDLCLDLHSAVRRLDPDPVAVVNPSLPGGVGMHLQRRIGQDLAQVGYVAQPARIVDLGCVEIGKGKRISTEKSGVPSGSPAAPPKPAAHCIRSLQRSYCRLPPSLAAGRAPWKTAC